MTFSLSADNGIVTSTFRYFERYRYTLTASNTQTIGTAGLSLNYKVTDAATVYTKYEASTMNHGIYDNGTVEVNYAF